jgi:hypothetical protein
MAQVHGQRKSVGKLLRAALRYLRKQDTRAAKRARPDQMTPERLRHMMEGENRRGYHYRPGGEDFPDRRITNVVNRDPATGVYEAQVEFYNDPPGAWQPKVGQGRSTFFPDHWTPAQCDQAVTDAFNGATKNADGSWVGQSNTTPPVPIMGYYDTATGAVRHGFPFL